MTSPGARARAFFVAVSVPVGIAAFVKLLARTHFRIPTHPVCVPGLYPTAVAVYNYSSFISYYY